MLSFKILFIQKDFSQKKVQYARKKNDFTLSYCCSKGYG